MNNGDYAKSGYIKVNKCIKIAHMYKEDKSTKKGAKTDQHTIIINTAHNDNVRLPFQR